MLGMNHLFSTDPDNSWLAIVQPVGLAVDVQYAYYFILVPKFVHIPILVYNVDILFLVCPELATNE